MGRTPVVGGTVVGAGRVAGTRAMVVAGRGAVEATVAASLLLRVPFDVAANEAPEAEPTSTTTMKAAATQPRAAVIGVTNLRRTRSSLAPRQVPGNASHLDWSLAQVRFGLSEGGGSGGMITRSPANSRFGSPGLGRDGRFSCTTCHQKRPSSGSVGGRPHASVKLAAAMDHRLSPGRTVQVRLEGAPARARAG